MHTSRQKFCRQGSHMTIDDEDNDDSGGVNGGEAAQILRPFFLTALVVDL